jgi:DNA (cytosine-5)-methyltransferase 1
MAKTIISLFSGAMGLDIGLETAGFKTVAALEINKAAIATIELNRPSLPVIDRNIELVEAREILKKSGLRRGEVTLLTGGPCCQSFSTAGKRRSIADERGGLFRHYLRIVSETRPRFFVMENVKGILSAAARHRPLDKRGPGCRYLRKDEELGSALRIILRELKALGYYVIYGLVNCADYGVPQKRMRVVFIGSRDGEEIRLPTPTHSKNGNPEWRTLREALGDLTDPDPEFVEFTDDRKRLLRQLKAGQNWSDLPKRLHRAALGGAFDSWGGRTGFCRRLSWNQPSPTLTTAPDGRATTLCHPTRLRPLTVREYARLQQFPNDWEFAGSISQRYELIGNAVPVGLGAAIGKMLCATMRKTARSKRSLRPSKRGIVECPDPTLQRRLRKRPRTQLHPAWVREANVPDAVRRWLDRVAA